MAPDALPLPKALISGVGVAWSLVFAALAGCAALPPLSSAPDLPTLAAPAGGTVGFAALDLASGRALGLHASDRFPTQSVFKLPIALTVLHAIDAGKLELRRLVALEPADVRGGPGPMVAVPGQHTVGALLEAMIVRSDNIACDKLLALVGGPRAVDDHVRALGVRGIEIRVSERELARGETDNTATPEAMVALLVKVARREAGLSVASAQLLDELLLGVTTAPKRIKGGLPPGTPVAHKPGTSGTVNGATDATNDVGLISLPNGNRIALAVFVHASPADQATREATIARLARAAYDAFVTPPGGR